MNPGFAYGGAQEAYGQDIEPSLDIYAIYAFSIRVLSRAVLRRVGQVVPFVVLYSESRASINLPQAANRLKAFGFDVTSRG